MSDPKQPTALTVRDEKQTAINVFAPRSLKEAMEVADWIATSRVYSGINTKEKAFAIMMRGAEMNLPLSVALTEVRIVEGKLSTSSQLLESLAMEDPEVEYFRMESLTTEKCVYVGKRKGEPEQKHEFTIDDAVRAKLTDRGKDEQAQSNNNWNKWRKTMLRRACAREFARMISPTRTLGIITYEEARMVAASTEEPPNHDEAPEQVKPIQQEQTAGHGEPVDPTVEETEDEAMLRLEKELRAATSQEAGAKVVKEIAKRWPESTNAHRRTLAGVLEQRKAAKWGPEKPAEPAAKQEEPPHDEETGEIKQEPQVDREPGEDG